jgi:hypothetical protein
VEQEFLTTFVKGIMLIAFMGWLAAKYKVPGNSPLGVGDCVVYMGGDPIVMTQEQKQLFLDGLTAEEKVALRIGEEAKA